MNNFSALDSRNRRNLLAHSLNAFSPPFHKNYSTDTTVDMKTSFGHSLFINTVHLVPEPMKMNLADSVVSLCEKKIQTNMADQPKVNNGYKVKKPQSTKNDYYPSLAGITNFFSGVFNVMGAIFQKRINTPVQYYDCFEQTFEEFEDHRQMTPSSLAWQTAKLEDQNINGRAQTDEFANETYTEFSIDMSNDFRSIAAHCEEKLNKVRLLLSNPQLEKTAQTRRPRRAFHKASSVEELFEDAFNPEDYISLANETFIEYCGPFKHHHEELQTIDAPRVRTNAITTEQSTKLIQDIIPRYKCTTNTGMDKVEDNVDIKKQIVSSCEDKVSQLKALLQNRRSQKTNLNETNLPIPSNNVGTAAVTSPISIPIEPETHNRSEVIDLQVTPEFPCVLDPNNYFDEVTGRFYSSSATDSEDSFQIVFSDSPQNRRKRIPSDCESEDSFIVFEESADSCYTSNDVFGDDNNDTAIITDTEDSDSDCESDLDSGLNTTALCHSLTRTVGDLTDGSLYEDSKSEDVVDCAFRSGAEIPGDFINTDQVTTAENPGHSECPKRGLLLNDTRKREKKNLPEKKVHFSPLPPKIHVMRVWAFAARQARAGQWERHALDRERFKRRIADVEVAVSWVLKPQHRSRIMFQRFMPWWNAQKRKELAEQKQKQAEENLMRERDRAEALAMEKQGERLRGNDASEIVKVEDKHITETATSKEEASEEIKTIQENAVDRMEQACNGNIHRNCKIANLRHSRNVIKSEKIIEEENKTVSDNKIVVKKIEIEKLCNGDNNLNCKKYDVIENNRAQANFRREDSY